MAKKTTDILSTVKTIAIVGISPKKDKDSYKVMQFLINKGYDVFPVNPNYNNEQILGRKCFSNIKEINEKIDMVDIFRRKEFVYDITKDAIYIKAKVIWTQLNIICDDSKNLAIKAGLDVIMNKCPKIELQK